MRALFFKTDTTGLVNKQAPLDDPSQPRLVILAASLMDDDRELGAFAAIVKPQDHVIPEESVTFHGITQERAELSGLPIRTVLNLFDHLAFRADIVISYNMEFHNAVLEIEALRAGVARLPIMERGFDMVQVCAQACQIPGPYGYAWPKLPDAYHHLVGRKLDKRPFILNDVYALRRIWEVLNSNHSHLLPQVRS